LALTQEGHYLLGRAQQIVGLVNKTTYHLQKQDVISGTIEIGAGESSGITPLMETLHQIMRQYPEVRVNLRSGDYEDILAGLDAGLLEFGVLMGYHNLNNYNTLQLPEENRWGVLMRADAQLAEKDVIQPIDLVGRPLITSRQAAQRGTFQIWSGDLFDQLNFVGTYNLIFNGSLLVKTGAVIALTYDKLIDNYTTKNGLVFRPLAPEITEPNTLVWSKNHQLPNLNRLFLDTLQKEIANND
jgi:DNA-binding transcriptional LysR family regulator